MVGLTVVVSWLGLVTGMAWLSWTSSQYCDCSRASYFPVRKIHREGYLRLNKKPLQPGQPGQAGQEDRPDQTL